MERSFSGSAFTWIRLQLEVQALSLGLRGELVRARHFAHQRVERQLARRERRRRVQRALVVEQLLDQALQLDAVVLHDPDHAALRPGKRAADLVVQQLGALAQRGERGLQLVRQVAQEAVLLRLELDQPAAQPVEALAERLQVLGTAHRDRLREIGAAELADGGVELGDRAGNVACQGQSARASATAVLKITSSTSWRCTVSASARSRMHLAVGDPGADREHLGGVVGRVGGERHDLAPLGVAGGRAWALRDASRS